MSHRVFRCPRPWFALTVVLIAAGPLRAQHDITNIPDPDPEIERRSFQVPTFPTPIRRSSEGPFKSLRGSR
jgi:hypothetical protein